jgi:NADH-quinone oxidoreductase subunit M
MIYGILAASGVIWSAFYMLWLYQRTFYGVITNPVNASLPDADLRERTVLWPLAVLALIMGVFPSLWMNSIDESVGTVLETQAAATSTHSLPVSLPVQARPAVPAPAIPVQVSTVLK